VAGLHTISLAGKHAIVTGAGSGIGQAIARAFSEAGARVVVADISEEAAHQTARELGNNSFAVQVDVSSEESVQKLVDTSLSELGRIDILCNNAGIGSYTNVADESLENWERVFAVNARGVFLCCKYTIPHMISQGGGTIVNIASVAGLIGLNNRAAYCASKGAVVTLTKQIAVSYVKDGIRCNCICPGTVDSPWIGRILEQADDPELERQNLIARQPLGRLGRPDEIARAALYVASDAAEFMTGSSLVIDGGILAQ
jgi:2-keto-3-deoxy-L-fuconate dehydrogenase